MKILVTGGAGFVGSHLCERLLDEGHTVFCVDNFSTGLVENIADFRGHPRFDLITCSVQDLGSLYVDQIYHLASPASPVFYDQFPVETIQANVQGTKMVLELAQKIRARVLFTSTSEVYGNPEAHPQTEKYNGNVNPIGPRSCYDESKRCGETLCSVYQRSYEVDARIVRIFNTYGTRMRRDDGRVVSNFITKALLEQPLEVYGDGSQTRSFQYVSDLIEGLVRVMNHEKNHGPINLGRPEEMTIRELAFKILQMTESKSSIIKKALPKDDPCIRKPDISKAKECLQWQPQITLNEGLEKTIEHFKRKLN